MHVLIVDDDELSRVRLKVLLEMRSNIEGVTEADSVDAALAIFDDVQPDLIFLDINMPGKNGFQLLEELSEHPPVVFTSAFDQYAIKAFEVNAIDYLIKPIEEVRLDQAFKKYDEYSASVLPEPQLDKTQFKDQNPFNVIFIKDGERCWFVKYADIRMIESDANYVRIHFENESPMINRTLTQIEEKIPADMFFRANRSQIVNVMWIEKISSWFGSSFFIKLKDGKEVKLSRRAGRKLRAMTEI
jgi:two-component system LytT family response regulator